MKTTMSKAKNSKPITKAKKAANKRKPPIKEEMEVSPWLEDYLDCFHLKYKPVTEKFLERISQEMLSWAKTNEKAYKISQFFSPKHIGYTTYTGWVNKYPQFAAAYNLAKTIIGDRRETGALERKLDAGTVIQMMPKYDPEWQEMVRERNEMKAQANEKLGGGTQFIVMEKFGSSDLVPKKPSKSPEEVAGEATMKNSDQMKLSK